MANIRKVQYTVFGMLALYMITGIGALVLANMWLSSAAAPREAVISREIEKAGAILGGIVAGTGLIGFVGAIAPIKRKDCLMAFIVLLIAVILAELGLGGVIWFKTLRMRSTFQDQWTNLWVDTLKIAFQDMDTLAGYGQCCGYALRTEVVSSGACAIANTASIGFPGCEEKISAFADGYLRKLFTSLFGFTIVNVFVFVTMVILIQTRNDEERYIRIGKKEGRTYIDSI
ncbi:phospholipid scramblase 1 [Mortierella hygrophila]|uniref:Phospholipid scramblase 1 n=1 Tax=Mortierella hygrophila TaxID=979708 RepID=A0A9P6FDZ1_9FUNG|nr:phospholipid scramblase 1 [Mortierella hygrophila]